MSGSDAAPAQMPVELAAILAEPGWGVCRWFRGERDWWHASGVLVRAAQPDCSSMKVKVGFFMSEEDIYSTEQVGKAYDLMRRIEQALAAGDGAEGES